MKIVHTADWHIGQSFYEYDRKREHSRFFDRLLTILNERRIDVLLIAGDIFDSSNPSAESQKMYYSFLREATNANPDLQIIIIAGNHDSAARLEAPNPLLESMNIAVRGVIKRTPDGDIDCERLLVKLNKGGYCLAVPYLRQGDYSEAGSYSSGVKALYDRLYELAVGKIAKEGGFAPIIAMGHLQATGSEISENDRSERTIIGGLECVSPEAFDVGIAYTALGHLHRSQRVSGRENVRYTGAPIPMSFAEKNNRHGVVLVEITPAGASIETLELDNTVELLSLSREAIPLPDVLDAIRSLPEGDATPFSPYLEIKVLVVEPEPSMRRLIEEALTGKAVRLARISAVTPTAGKTSENGASGAEMCELQSVNPMDMAAQLFERQYGNEMPENIKKLLHEIIREAEQ